MASSAVDLSVTSDPLEVVIMIELRRLPVGGGAVTVTARRKPTVVLATVTVCALAWARGLAGTVVTVGARELRMATGKRQMAFRRRQVEDPADRRVAVGALPPTAVRRGVAGLTRLGRQTSALGMTSVAADHRVNSRAGVEVRVGVHVGDRPPRLKAVALRAIAEVGELVPVCVRMTPFGVARPTRIERRVGRAGFGRRRGPIHLDDGRDDNCDNGDEDAERYRDSDLASPRHAAV